ncbi:hypothetical protein Dimus_035489 [Dionaea muscipula]
MTSHGTEREQCRLVTAQTNGSEGEREFTGERRKHADLATGARIGGVAFVESINRNVVVVLENGLSNSLTRFTRRRIREQQAASVSPPYAATTPSRWELFFSCVSD